jgi:hypothetical protein
MADFRMPRNDEHVVVVGRNGTGKSQAGFWILSERDLANNRNFVIDYKGEELFSSLRNIRPITEKEIPTENGLYIIYGDPEKDDEMRGWMRRIRKQGNAGIFVDEGYMIPGEKRGPFQHLLTQGRALQIPIITLSQRPVEINRFVFSEASHTLVFDLNDDRDKDTIREFTPRGFMDWVPSGLSEGTDLIDPHTGEKMLPPFHFKWYNKKDNSRFALRPVPSADELTAKIDGQLKPKHQWI